MRPDFNKLLTERERYGHRRHFGEERHAKIFAPDQEVAGRESMKARYKDSSKSFNENLSPLKKYLHTRVNKSWDKTYSEIRKTFDARKVTNNHILEHLFQYVELNVKIIDGKPCVLSWRHDWQPVHGSFSLYWVDPRTGVLRSTRAMSDRQRRKSLVEREAEIAFANKRVLDKNTDLVKIGDGWFILSKSPVPAPVIRYTRPDSMEHSTWCELSTDQKAAIGTPYEQHSRFHEVHNDGSRHAWVKQTWYYSSKKSASAKLLREHNIS